jgi:molybdate transport system substrate-binding protein
VAKQIEQGAPADVFLSADTQCRPARQRARADRGKGFQNRTRRLADGGRIAVADLRAVPAGLYAKAALENLGVWAAVQDKLAQAENVRAALSYVSRGEAPLGSSMRLTPRSSAA